MLHKYPLSTRFLILIVTPLALLCTFVYFHAIQGALPTTHGELRVDGVQQEVKIERDEHGVAKITAHTDRDVYFAMGYLHAQDRLWQLELQRRISQGRLSEVFGESTLRDDIWIRTLGVYRSAQEAMDDLSQEALDSLDAYSAGINAWLSTHDKLPVEFLILDVEPEPWEAVDSLAWIKMFALDLAGNYQDEMQRYLATQYIDHDKLVSLFPDLSKQLSRDAEELSGKHSLSEYTTSFQRLQADIDHQFGKERHIKGSNAWVISGELTGTGLPLLANDPHLGLMIPSLWYAVAQEGESLKAEGMSLVGLPTIIFGKNEQIAWGGTNMMADTQDLFIEQTDTLNPSRYLHNGQWKNFTTREEQIHVKAKAPAQLRSRRAPVDIRVRESVHGPIISDVLRDLDVQVALQWTALNETDPTYESFYRISYAHDWESFKEALTGYVAPAMNLLYADTDNNIGFIGVGEIPVRAVGTGVLPVPGGLTGSDWNGVIPFAEMPQELNPANGFLVSANNKNVPDDFPYFISNDWALPARADRITQLIEGYIAKGVPLDVSSSQLMQADQLDLSAVELLEVLKSVNVTSEQGQQVLEELRKWDGVADTDSVGATIFYTWQRHIRRKLFSDEFQFHWNKHGIEGYSSLINTVTAGDIAEILNEDSTWCDDVASDKKERCDQVVRESFDSTVSQLTKLSGFDVSNWQWGGVHNAVFEHAPFSDVKLLDRYFERRISSGGAANAVNVSGATFSESKGYVQNFGAGFRQIVQLDSSSPRHLYMNSTGQSGQVASKHYDDMIEAFRDVRYFEFNFSQVETLVLKPTVAAGRLP